MNYSIIPTPPIKVYAKVNDKNEIVNVDSDVFLQDVSGWIYIGEGYGDKYAHAQTQYFDRPIKTSDGKYSYTIVGNTVFAN